MLALAADGYLDPEIARRLTAEGFRSARDPTGAPTRFVAKVHNTANVSLSEQFRQQEQLDGKWWTWAWRAPLAWTATGSTAGSSVARCRASGIR